MGHPSNWKPIPDSIARFELDTARSTLKVTGLKTGFAQWNPGLPDYHPVWIAVIGQPRSAPTLIAHHGLPADAPENTLAGVRMACGLSIPGIEVDVRFTADSVPVLIHDRSVDRTSNGTGNVDEMSLAQLKQLDFGSWFGPQYAGEAIPTLRDFLAVSGACGFDLIQLDVKGFLPIGVDSGLVRVALEANRANLLSRVQFGSSLISELRRASVLIPGARTVLYAGTVTQSIADAAIQNQIEAVSVAFPVYNRSSAQLSRLDSMGVAVGVWGEFEVLDLNGLVPPPALVTSDWRWRLLW
jgi:glycerophosphoryl diester phosphodiesterase